MLEYKGYTGIMEVDDEAGILFGRVIGLRDVVTFQGVTVSEARDAFRESVDDYLEFCESLGRPPEKPFSGKFLLRVKPELHRALANSAEIAGTSLNSLVEQLLMDAIRSELAERPRAARNQPKPPAKAERKKSLASK